MATLDEGTATSPQTGPPPTRARWRPRRVEPLLYLLPSLVLLAAVYFIPVVSAVRDSFTDVSLLGGGHAVGLANYAAILEPDRLRVIGRTIVWVAATVAGATVCGFALALLLDKPMPMRGLLRIIVILPWIFPESIAGVMWRYTLHPEFGIVNEALQAVGLIDQGINFFDHDSALLSALLINIWRTTPFIYLTALAGLQAISSEIEEASLIDGASAWQRIRYVTLPLMRPVLSAAAVILSAWTIVNFDLVFVLTGGGPDDATTLLAIDIYNAGFLNFDLGAASALAVVSVALVMCFGYFYVRRSVGEAQES